ncbi:hypothetical protein BYT27DRAFT_7012753, partial [Phlegmacium glaucopus]
QAVYRKWCKQNNFESMLPKDTKARRATFLETTLRQSQVDSHFNPMKPEDKPKPYTNKLFKEAAIQWLIETDQPIQAFDHPAFQKMVETAAHATHG